jgi:soluble lytic murein transglycosylase-like protein
LPGVVTSAVGEALGVAASRLAVKREDELNAMIGRMLSDPSLIKIAAAPPTKENVFKLMNALERAGFVAARGAAQEESPVATQTPAMDLEQENMMLEQRIMELEKEYQPAEAKEVKIGKQNISALIDDVATKYGVNANELSAIAQVESSFNPKAVGPKTRFGQAKGLMQLIPETAEALGVKNPFDAKQSLEGASKLLKELEDFFGKYNDRRFIWAAYNSRPVLIRNAIDKVKADGDKVTWSNVSEYVPRETKNYVNKISSLT